MNTEQSFISIGALVVFSLVSSNFDSTVLTNTTVEFENKVYLTTFSLADDFFQKIKYINSEFLIKPYEVITKTYPSRYWELTINLGDL